MATPTRIESDLYEAAKSVGAVMSRSAAQQVNHWARIGRELELAGGVSQQDIGRVLAGSASYDDLGGGDQAVVRAVWDERMSEARTALDLTAEFEAAGVDGWVTGDDEGRAVVNRTSASHRGR